jgi:hypothetical protein
MSARVRQCACGRVGLETADDPAPGVCPVCLDERLARLTRRLFVLVDVYGPVEALARIRPELVGAGLRAPVVDAFLAAAARGEVAIPWGRV